MFLLTKEIVDSVSHNDVILELLHENSVYPDSLYSSHMRLADSLQRRAIYSLIYREYLYSSSNTKILDIEGGYSSLTKLLMKNTEKYDLIAPSYEANCNGLPKAFNPLIGWDWYTHELTEEYDVVIANGLFPNNDQRLGLFLDKYLKVCHKMVLSLTFFNNPKFYTVYRTEGDEKLCLLAYSGEQIKNILEKYIDNIINPDFPILDSKETVFTDGRQVCIVTIEGEL